MDKEKSSQVGQIERLTQNRVVKLFKNEHEADFKKRHNSRVSWICYRWQYRIIPV